MKQWIPGQETIRHIKMTAYKLGHTPHDISYAVLGVPLWKALVETAQSPNPNLPSIDLATSPRGYIKCTPAVFDIPGDGMFCVRMKDIPTGEAQWLSRGQKVR